MYTCTRVCYKIYLMQDYRHSVTIGYDKKWYKFTGDDVDKTFIPVMNEHRTIQHRNCSRLGKDVTISGTLTKRNYLLAIP